MVAITYIRESETTTTYPKLTPQPNLMRTPRGGNRMARMTVKQLALPLLFVIFHVRTPEKLTD
jgi:hypothetical protein